MSLLTATLVSLHFPDVRLFYLTGQTGYHCDLIRYYEGGDLNRIFVFNIRFKS